MIINACELNSDFRILITGASGFAGCWLREGLRASLPKEPQLFPRLSQIKQTVNMLLTRTECVYSLM